PAGRGSPAHGVAAVGGDALSVGSHRRGEPVAAPGGLPQGASERRLTWKTDRASLPGSPGRGSRTVLDLRGVSFVEAVDHRAGVVVTGALGEIGLPGKFLGQFARR